MKFVSLSRPLLLLAAGVGLSLTANADGHHRPHHKNHRTAALDGQHPPPTPQPKDGPKHRRHKRVPPHRPAPAPKPTPPPH